MNPDKPFIERTEDARPIDLLNMGGEDYEMFFGEAAQSLDKQARRLQQLRAEFEAAREEWQRGVRGDPSNHLVWNAMRLVEIDGRDINLLGPLTPDDVALISGLRICALGSVGLAARRYIIARDFNEFDPGKADMLWKLQKQ